jgi:hypothetical protein
LQILTEMLPRVARVGILWCGALNPTSEQEWAETQEAAKVLGLQLSSPPCARIVVALFEVEPLRGENSTTT